jgi:hypothetical protein
MLIIPVNEATPLRILTSDGATSLYGRLNIYNSSGTLLHTLNTSHVAEGLYTVNWTPTIEGVYTMVGQFFADVARTIDAGYEKVSDEIDVSSMKSNVLRILGLNQENTVIDLQVYDGNNNITSARIRTYNSKPNALAAGVTGLVATYSMTAAYSGNLLTDYKVVRDS